MKTLTGIPASPGIAIGPVHLYQKAAPGTYAETSLLTLEEETRRLEQAVEQAKAQLDRLMEKTQREAGEAAAQIFDIHKMMLDDLDYRDAITDYLSQSFTAEKAVAEASEEMAQAFAAMEDQVMQARSADVRDIGQRLLGVLTGRSEGQTLTTPSVIAARDLFPSDTMGLDKNCVLAFVTEQGSFASHSAILARTLGIPAIVGAADLMEALTSGQPAIVDGTEGKLILDPDQATLADYQARRAAFLAEQEGLEVYRDRESVTKDGVHIEVCANIAYAADADAAAEAGADGIGLMRSEFLYMDADDFPDEESQFQAYRQVLQRMGGKRVVVRTLDIGADKVPRYLPMDPEENPALGCRAIRLCFAHPDLFRTQLRALLRASTYGKLAIMFPMIGSLEELRRAKALLNQCRQELAAEGIPVADQLEVGMMVEVPSAAILSDLLAPEVDFFSIGTNDLTQYTLAADRLNEKVSGLFNYGDQAVLRLIAHTAESASRHGIWCGICGESAGDLDLLPFYAKCGIRELSVVPKRVLGLRKAVTQLDVSAL